MRNQNPVVGQINLFHIAHEHLGAAQELSEGIHNVRDLEIAGSYLVKHRREEEEVVPADQAKLHVPGSRRQLLHVECCKNNAKTSTDDDDSLAGWRLL